MLSGEKNLHKTGRIIVFNCYFLTCNQDRSCFAAQAAEEATAHRLLLLLYCF